MVLFGLRTKCKSDFVPHIMQDSKLRAIVLRARVNMETGHWYCEGHLDIQHTPLSSSTGTSVSVEFESEAEIEEKSHC